MVRGIVRGLYLLLIGAAVSGAQPCPFDEAAWKGLSEGARQKLMEPASAAAIDDSCFVKLERRLILAGAAGRLAPLLRERCDRRQHFSLELLHRSSQLIASSGDKTAGREVSALWERYNIRFREAAERLHRQGGYRSLDSLYSAFDNLGRLDVYDRLQWGGVKVFLNDFGQAAAVYCAALRQESGLSSIVQSQCASQLEDLDNGQRHELLQALAGCGQTIADRQLRADMLDWIVRMYARFGFRQEETSALASGLADTAASAEMLLYAAQRFFEQKLFRQVLDPARRAWAQYADAAERSRCSQLLCQTYASIGRVDSTALWLGRANIADRRGRVAIATQLQQAGMAPLADSVIGLLPPSIDKDTLTMRGSLFGGRIKEAAEFARTRLDKPYWKALPGEVLLWRMRTALFSGEYGPAAAVIDSTEISPSWPCGQELLAQKHALSLMEMDPGAFALWGRINYLLYVGKASTLADSLQIGSFLPAVQELMATTLAEGLLDQDRVAPAKKVLGLLPDSTASARVQFFRGRCDFQAGDFKKATERFERLIMNHPQDIFSSKARMYLLKMESAPGSAKAGRGR
jgi:tetratricopeptide (TPR) repeat protein